MDTLAIVRKIREAESLADAGRHEEARRVLEPLADDEALSETQRRLVARKIELFDRQHERMTRIVSRRTAAASDDSSAGTVIRNPEENRSDRSTDVAIETQTRGVPTEVVPRARDVDTEVLPDRPTPAQSDRAGAFPRVSAGDSQELAPVEDERIDNGDDDDDPRSTEVFEAQEDTNSNSGSGRSDAAAPADDASVTVRDSIVIPRDDDDPSNRTPADLARVYCERPDEELRALAERLPDDDLRRELALEVVRLRAMLNGEQPRTDTRRGSRRHRREQRPDSGSFRIPASEVNTIVRTAAGTDQIEVHMPARDEDEAELQVLRRDSVRGKKVEDQSSDRVALAQDYIDGNQLSKPGLLKPVATYLGAAVVLGVIVWAAYLGYRSLAGAEEPAIDITRSGVGEFELGADAARYDQLENAGVEGERRARGYGWILQHDAGGRITAITVPGPEHSAAAASRFERLSVVFEGNTLALGEGAGPDAVIQALGEPTPRFSEELFNTSTEYTVTYVSRQGDRTLEFRYVTARPEAPQWIRIRTDAAPDDAPDLGRYRDDE